MMNLLKMQECKIEMWKQKRLGKILPEAFDARMEIKDEQMYLEIVRLSALLCATCEEIGRPDKTVVKIDFGPVVDDE